MKNFSGRVPTQLLATIMAGGETVVTCEAVIGTCKSDNGVQLSWLASKVTLVDQLDGSLTTHQSITVFSSDGSPVVHALSGEAEGKELFYKLDHEHERTLSSNIGRNVLVTGPRVDIAIDQNNLAAILLAMHAALRKMDSGTKRSAVALFPEVNRTSIVTFHRQSDAVSCPELGMRYRMADNGNFGALSFLSASLELTAKWSNPGRELYRKCLRAVDHWMMQRNHASVASIQAKFKDTLASDAPTDTLILNHQVEVSKHREGRKHGSVILLGGTGEYDPRGFTRLGENIGYDRWIDEMTRSGCDVLSISRSEVPAQSYESVYRPQLLSLLNAHIARLSESENFFLVGHSMGGLVAADIVPYLVRKPTRVALVSTPAKGMRKTILRQAFNLLSPRHPPSFSHRTLLRQQNAGLDAFLGDNVTSVAAGLRKADVPQIRYFIDATARHLLARWPARSELLVIHGTCDEQVAFQDSLRWQSAAHQQNIRTSFLQIGGGDHVLKCRDCSSDEDADRLVTRVVDAVVGKGTALSDGLEAPHGL